MVISTMVSGVSFIKMNSRNFLESLPEAIEYIPHRNDEDSTRSELLYASLLIPIPSSY